MPQVSNIYRRLMLAVMTVAFSGLFTILPAVEAEAAQSKCGTWIRVVDISSNNIHPIDFKKLNKAGVAGVYIKNSENTNYVNPFFKPDVAAVTKAGIPFGTYYFAQPGKSDPIASARFYVKSGGALGQFPPALDLEVTTISPLATGKWAVSFMQEVERLSKRKPIIYVGANFGASLYPPLKQWDLWLPAYPNGYKPAPNVCALPMPRIPAPWAGKGWIMWQYTSSATPQGIHGRVDMNATESAWFNKWTGTGVLPPTPGVNRYPQPIYAIESHGTKVVAIQRLLVNQKLLPKSGIDGVYGEQTKAAVKKWQAIIKVKVDGMWSTATDVATRYYLKHHIPKPTPISAPVLKLGVKNYSAVRSLQGLLNKHGAQIAVDGAFGPKTDKAVRAFQKSHKLPVNGVVNNPVWIALWK